MLKNKQGTVLQRGLVRQQARKGCEDGDNSKKIEWLSTSTTCGAPMNGKDDPSAVVYQDRDSVSFTASVKESFGKVGGWKKQYITMEWLAIHFVGTKGESECSISENIELCHHDEEQEQAGDTATCDKNGFAVVQIFFKDDGLVPGHTIAEVNHDSDDEEETVDVHRRTLQLRRQTTTTTTSCCPQQQRVICSI